MVQNKNIKHSKHNISNEGGFTLIEVIIAVFVLGIAVVALVEVMAAGLKMNSLIKDQEDALDITISNIDTAMQVYKEPPQTVEIDIPEGWEAGISSLTIKPGLLQKITSDVKLVNNEQTSITTYQINNNFTAQPEIFPLSQFSYRWYENVDSYTPTSALSEKNDILTNVTSGKVIRLRISVKAGVALNKSTQQFKLEYSANTEDGWTQVGDAGSVSKAWTGFNNFSSEDGGDITALLDGNNIAQSYEEQNSSVANKQQIGVGEIGEWDWVIKENGAHPDTVYFFRMVLINGTHLDRYMRYATLRTSPQTSYIQKNYRWYENSDSVTPATALAGEGTARVSTVYGEKYRLRISLEVDGNLVPKTTQAFNLQYATEIFGTWTYLGDVGSNDAWIGVNNSSVQDEVVIPSLLLSTSTLSGTYQEEKKSGLNPVAINIQGQMEFDWAIKDNTNNQSATKYYFRIVDADGIPLSYYSIYPTITVPPVFVVGNLTNNAAADYYPSWSPDGTKIAFGTNRDGNGEIYVMNADGSNLTNLTNNAAADYYPSWSPDGTKIAFYTNRDGNYEIYVMNADGSNLTNLTNNASADSRPSWSPDGTKIAFGTNRDGNYEIYVMNADGSNLTNLTNNASVDNYPSWSPDGTKIAFGTTRDGNNEIYVMNTDGSNLTNLTNNAADDNRPSWSPDGTKIVFYTTRDGNYEIYVMNADGSNLTNLTNNAADDSNPSWSPDGTKIAFRTTRDGNYEIYVMIVP